MSRETAFLKSLANILWYGERTSRLWVYPTYMKYCIPVHCSEKGEIGPLIKIVKKGSNMIEIHFERVLPNEELGERRLR